jgi:uncharacterized protein YjiS (DUF1127 family)
MSAATTKLSLAHARPALPAKAGWTVRVGQMLRAMRTRTYLCEMDDRMLKDIGVSRMDASREANRWPWDLR